MSLAKQIKTLIKKDLTLEFKSLESLAGILLFLVATTYTCYLTFQKVPDAQVWNALYWVIIIFSAFNALSGSFKNETGGKHFYLFFLVKPKALILSKIIYNSMLMLALSLLGFLVFSLFLGTKTIENVNLGNFLLCIILSAVGFSGVLTIISAIASQLNFKGGMMTVLGLPLLFPLILVSQKTAAMALSGASIVGNLTFLLGLLTFDIAVIILSYVLFPYLWRQ